MPIGKRQLDKTKCMNPNCEHDNHYLVLSSKCHPGAGLKVAYDQDTGNLLVSCNECNAPITAIVVGDLPQDEVGPASVLLPLRPTRYQH